MPSMRRLVCLSTAGLGERLGPNLIMPFGADSNPYLHFSKNQVARQDSKHWCGRLYEGLDFRKNPEAPIS